MPINNNDLAYLATLAETAPKPDPSGMALHLVKLARAVNGGTCDYVDSADDIARLIDAFADANDPANLSARGAELEDALKPFAACGGSAVVKPGFKGGESATFIGAL